MRDFASCFVVVSLVLSSACDATAEPAGPKLMRPGSLAGWEYGPTPPAGWTIAEGQLSGDSRSTPLVSGFTFGDFVLTFEWSVEEAGVLVVRFPDVPSGEGLVLTLCEGPNCGQVQDRGKAAASGKNVGKLDGKTHSAEVRRAGPKLSVAVDGQKISEATIQPERRFGLGLAVPEGKATIVGLRAEEPAGEPLFNGRELNDWWTLGNMKAWSIEDGCLVLHGPNGNYLRTKKEYGNFTLSMEYLMPKGGNSGIGIRTPHDGWPSGDGMELQLMDVARDKPLDKHSEMAIYGNVPPLARADNPREWNRAVIRADGFMISAWVNGELVQHVNTEHHPELKHRHLKGWIGIQDHNAEIRIRNMRLLEAPDGTGLPSWHVPPRPTGASVLLDRLMNRQLDLPPEIRSGVVSKSISGDMAADHVLAELTGPGAVTRIARTNDEGTLAFYFDGESKPRLTCKPANLISAVPALTENPDTAVTYLAYEKALKIVLRKAKRADYRVDYVTMPADLPVETFRTSESGIPRSWLSAINYRMHQHGWGGHRENDPLPRIQSPAKTIRPGKTETMLEAKGAGVIQWVKLRADKKVLNTNDLWLEARFDGQSQPAVSTPARFWFPGLAGQGNYPNFVLVDRAGVTNMLVMPFARSAVLSLSNRGKRPIAGVELTVSVQYSPATESARTVDKRMQLRAVFQPAGDGSSSTGDLVRQEGAGRWVGLVYEENKGDATGIERLVVDSEEQAGWKSPNLDLFLGHAGDFRGCLSGRHQGLAWRYLLLEPVSFHQSLVLRTDATKLGNRLAIFYTPPEALTKEK